MTALTEALKDSTRHPTTPGDWSTAGFLLKIKFRATTEEELRDFLGVLKRSETIGASEEDLWVAKRLFFVCVQMLTWVEVYKLHPARYSLIKQCVSEAGRVIGEDAS